MVACSCSCGSCGADRCGTVSTTLQTRCLSLIIITITTKSGRGGAQPSTLLLDGSIVAVKKLPRGRDRDRGTLRRSSRRRRRRRNGLCLWRDRDRGTSFQLLHEL
jgi:hypothetical protein